MAVRVVAGQNAGVYRGGDIGGGCALGRGSRGGVVGGGWIRSGGVILGRVGFNGNIYIPRAPLDKRGRVQQDGNVPGRKAGPVDSEDHWFQQSAGQVTSGRRAVRLYSGYARTA